MELGVKTVFLQPPDLRGQGFFTRWGVLYGIMGSRLPVAGQIN